MAASVFGTTPLLPGTVSPLRKHHYQTSATLFLYPDSVGFSEIPGQAGCWRCSLFTTRIWLELVSPLPPGWDNMALLPPSPLLLPDLSHVQVQLFKCPQWLNVLSVKCHIHRHQPGVGWESLWGESEKCFQVIIQQVHCNYKVHCPLVTRSCFIGHIKPSSGPKSLSLEILHWASFLVRSSRDNVTVGHIFLARLQKCCSLSTTTESEKHPPMLRSTVVVHPETGQLPFKVNFKAGIDPQEQHLGPEKTNRQRYPQKLYISSQLRMQWRQPGPCPVCCKSAWE